MKEVFLVDYQRTPVGKYGALLSGIRPDDLAAAAIQALRQRNIELDAAAIDEGHEAKIDLLLAGE